MKCIKLNDGTIKRVTDSIAYTTVSNNDAQYISKTDWKNHIYGLDDETRKKFPANIEGSVEFIKGLSKEEKQKEKRKKHEEEKKKMLYSQKKSKKTKKK